MDLSGILQHRNKQKERRKTVEIFTEISCYHMEGKEESSRSFYGNFLWSPLGKSLYLGQIHLEPSPSWCPGFSSKLMSSFLQPCGWEEAGGDFWRRASNLESSLHHKIHGFSVSFQLTWHWMLRDVVDFSSLEVLDRLDRAWNNLG